ncbi:PIN domain-containing protein [Micromonospora sp. NPDC051006]|uniref:PIN domain-containing protein n=1 Tax=Micromonospora sp. NPDC051006 TaxID=3364283 RepID=UPI00378FDD62
MIAHAMKSGLIVLDTNVLLGAYRFAAKAREELLSALEQARDRLWIPHQVAHEFHRNRFSVIAEHDAAYKVLLDALQEHRKTIEGELATKIRELSNRVALADKERERLLSMAHQGLNPLQRAIDALRGSHGLAEPTSHDPVLHRLERIFEDRVGEPYTDEEKARAAEEAQRRADESVPPGYKDAGKADSSGDYFVWSQTLGEAARRRPNYLIFVTGDTKEDWYLRIKGKTIIGRPELTDECSEKTGARLVVMPTKSFLRYAREHLNADVSVETLQQAAKVSARPEELEYRRRLEDRLMRLESDHMMVRAQARDVAAMVRRAETQTERLRSSLLKSSSEEAQSVASSEYAAALGELEQAEERLREYRDREVMLRDRLNEVEYLRSKALTQVEAAAARKRARVNLPVVDAESDL